MSAVSPVGEPHPAAGAVPEPADPSEPTRMPVPEPVTGQAPEDSGDEAQPAAPPAPPEPEVPVLAAPREGVPRLVDEARRYADLVDAVAAGSGPVALDAERASGYRYSQRAYLVQLRRAGTGTALVDPIAVRDLSALSAAMGDATWVLHAANQDLACLAEVGMRPAALFDTELAGRLLGLPRVGLAAMTASLLGIGLKKEHSAADWSTRPLPADWLVYAALDVELLLEMRDVLEQRLAEAGKSVWAAQEFEAVRTAPPPPPREEPWRRLSGLHQLRKARQVAAARELWRARDTIAVSRDIAPGRILPDRAVIDAATKQPTSVQELTSLPVFGGRANRAISATWFGALTRAAQLPEDDLPSVTVRSGELPPTRVWADREPDAARRFAAARAAMLTAAAERELPVENLLTPELVRRLTWAPPEDHSVAGVSAWLADRGARRWQIEITAPLLAAALE
jgi:ribonuclease D